MKKLKLYALLFFLATFVACSKSDAENQGGKKSPPIMWYGPKTFIVKYDKEGMETGTVTLYSKNHGWEEAKIENTVFTPPVNIPGMDLTQKRNIVTIRKGEWTWVIDPDAGTGRKIPTPLFEQLKGKDLEKVGEEMMKAMGGEKIGQEEFLGKMCGVWENKNLGTRILLWKNIILKSKTDLRGMNATVIATELQVGVKIPEEPFNILSKWQITEDEDAGDPLKMLEKMKKGYKKN
ncbi:MAG: hypothetical protein ACE5HX_08215 [bacterium]